MHFYAFVSTSSSLFGDLYCFVMLLFLYSHSFMHLYAGIFYPFISQTCIRIRSFIHTFMHTSIHTFIY